jgi:hypothetical protein
MSRLDDLPPDQRAVLLLLVQQGKSHAEIADMLAIPESAVRERAHAGLEALAGAPVSARPASRPQPEARSREPSSPPPPPPPPGHPAPAGRVASPTRSTTGLSSSTASRRAGALLLGAIVVAIVVVVLLISGGGGSHKSSSANSKTTGNSTTSAAAGEPHIDKQLNLISPDPASKAVGLVEVLSQGGKRAFLVTAEHLPPAENGSFYAAWLYNSASNARVLGRAPNVSSNGQLQAVGSLPPNAGTFHQMLITRETNTKPSHPGPIVLSGPFSLR